MTSFSLLLGCALIAFSPFLLILFNITYSKAQLVILVTTSAFAYLIGSLLSSLIYLVLSPLRETAIALIIPSVIIQSFVIRPGFVNIYHKVEDTIEAAIQRHEEQESRRITQNNPTLPSDGAMSAAMRLALNDWTSGIASGCGYGGMHAMMLYGTLLASESNDKGTLYQKSCTFIPSIFNSAFVAMLFSILDVILMLLSFYAMRHRKFDNNTTGLNVQISSNNNSGNLALLVAFVAHAVASFVTTANSMENGCLVSLPALFCVVLTVGLFFWKKIAPVFSEDQMHLHERLD